MTPFQRMILDYRSGMALRDVTKRSGQRVSKSLIHKWEHGQMDGPPEDPDVIQGARTALRIPKAEWDAAVSYWDWRASICKRIDALTDDQRWQLEDQLRAIERGPAS